MSYCLNYHDILFILHVILNLCGLLTVAILSYYLDDCYSLT
jgi:hypothetical protein